MPIFISYSHQNKEFVDQLARQLVVNQVNVWLDRWELSIGDSLIEKVQEAADGASALLVILSAASVESEWCKKELSGGLLRELEEKRVVVMPVLLEDCDIPLFTRGKLYADFRTNFDTGLRTVLEGVAKVTNPRLARAKEPEYHIDWSLDWGAILDGHGIILNYVEQAENQPYTCLTNIEVLFSEVANTKYEKELLKFGEDVALKNVMGAISGYFESHDPVRPLLVTSREKVELIYASGELEDEGYRLRIGTRRLGEDTGRDILINTTNLINQTYQHMKEVLSAPNGGAV